MRYLTIFSSNLFKTGYIFYPCSSCQFGLDIQLGLMSAILACAATECCTYLRGGNWLITTVFSVILRPGQEGQLPWVPCFRGSCSGPHHSMLLSIQRQTKEQGYMLA